MRWLIIEVLSVVGVFYIRLLKGFNNNENLLMHDSYIEELQKLVEYTLFTP